MLFTLFSFLCLLAITTNASAGIDNIQNELIEWVRSKGGSFSDKLEIRRVDPGDPTSYLGVFVREPIPAKESLFVIPRDCFVHVFDTATPYNENEDDEATINKAYFGNLCQLANKLMGEMKLGTDSEYAPYIAYLQTQKPGQTPANWSPQGKELLRKVVVPGSPMVDWIDWNFKGEKHDCLTEFTKSNDSEISFEEHMVEMTLQRCYDTALIPIWDMVNHDNGRINTENDSMHDPEGMKVRALVDLKAGEEIFASYDKCLDCGELSEYWGTPEILKDFGFVENYPHRWIFGPQVIWVEVYDDEEYDFVAWFSEVEGTPPSEQQLDFLRKEVARLEAISLGEQGDIPDREWDTIQRYHKAAFNDLSAVVEWYDGQAEAEEAEL